MALIKSHGVTFRSLLCRNGFLFFSKYGANLVFRWFNNTSLSTKNSSYNLWSIIPISSDVHLVCTFLIISKIPSKVRSCVVPPDHLRSDIVFSRACNIPATHHDSAKKLDKVFKHWKSRKTRSHL